VQVNVRANLVRSYILENNKSKNPLSKKKLSELISYKYPDLGDPEAIRSTLRALTGSHGDYKRSKLKTIEWITIPDPEVEDYSKVEVNDKRIGILSDIHLPYYDKKALVSAVNSIKNFDATTIILNGDIIDCYHLSNFDKDPRNRSFKYELDMLKNFFEDIRKAFPKARILYKIGNHEERYERAILQRLPALIDLDLVSFENVIKAKEFGIEVIKNKRVIKIGKLNVIHGHEIRAGIISPVNIARGFFLKTKASTLGGHHHRTSEHIEHDLNGDFIGCFSTGCLCGLTPGYMPINSWNHGFALMENYGNDFHVRNLKIINGKVL